MSETKLMDNFVLLTGLTYEEALAYQPLCLASMEKISARLGSWADTESNAERITLAAAADAAYSYIASRQSADSFQLGDLSVQKNRLEEIRAMAELAESCLEGLTEREGYAFEGVGA